MKLLWLSDIHLNFLTKSSRNKFYESIVLSEADLVMISGDIAEGPSVSAALIEMGQAIAKPIYFVLGNHDYYQGQVQRVRETMTQLTQNEPLLHWLPASKPVLIKDRIYLVGQDGWADGRNGDFFKSPVAVNDSRLIDDLYQADCKSKAQLVTKMRELADNDAIQLREKIREAIALDARQVIIVTHVPPFKENCYYRGRTSSDDFLPFYSSRATGDMLLVMAEENPEIHFWVFCGHTHAKSTYQPRINLLVRSGEAEYYRPSFQEIIQIE